MLLPTLRIEADYAVLGPPAGRRPGLARGPELGEHQVWQVDSAHRRVDAVWAGGALWLAGEAVYAIVEGIHTPLEPEAVSDTGVTKIVPIPGARYVVSAGPAKPPDPRLRERERVLAGMLELDPEPQLGWVARLLGKTPPPAEAVALVLDVSRDLDATAETEDLEAWLGRLQAAGVDLSWTGNEAGPGFVHAFRRTLGPDRSVPTTLLDHAHEDPTLRAMIREHVEIWLEGTSEPEAKPSHEAKTGWDERLELDAIVDNIRGGTGAWLDPGTAHARAAWTHQVPGTAVLAAIRRCVDAPAIVAVHSAPEDAVLAIHLIGGLDRATGELVGFALARVWT